MELKTSRNELTWGVPAGAGLEDPESHDSHVTGEEGRVERVGEEGGGGGSMVEVVKAAYITRTRG